MDKDESYQLLCTKLEVEELDRNELSLLSSRLEYLPLALVQAAAFIVENTIPVKEYLRLLGQSDQQLVDLLSEEFETAGRDSETPRAVTETWILSFEQIQRQSGFAGELLSLMSLFDRQAIPRAFLSQYSEQQQGQKLRGELQLTKALECSRHFLSLHRTKARVSICTGLYTWLRGSGLPTRVRCTTSRHKQSRLYRTFTPTVTTRVGQSAEHISYTCMQY